MLRKRSQRLLPLCLTVIFSVTAAGFLQAQEFEPNYDESKIPAFELPEIFHDAPSDADSFQAAWPARRAELVEIFAEQMYGRAPTEGFEVQCELIESGPSLGGKVTRRQYRVTVSTEAGNLPVDLAVFTPAAATERVPIFLGLNFYGNHTVANDPELIVTKSWSRNTASKGVVDNRATEAGRGTSRSRWPIEMICDAGFGVATCYCADFDPDIDDQFQNGVHALFPEHRPSTAQPDRWGTIAAWAWGLSRMLDAFEKNIDVVDSERVVVIGHSRLGKTSLWAAANDKRFAGAISNNSGCGGAALSRRAVGETVWRINTSFPHWFCPNFHAFNNNEAALPIDQHQLIAAIAPRPVYVASASEDLWADPRGEFLSIKMASPIYTRLGLPGLAISEFPEANSASISRLSYHLRAGEHDIRAWDWRNYLAFAEEFLPKR